MPEWCTPDGERILTTRDCYPPPQIPEHAVVIGSGVTGVEFVHMLSSLGSKVTLIVSRQQVLPTKDPEVAAALEADFLARGVVLLKGARAVGIDVDDGVVVRCDDGRQRRTAATRSSRSARCRTSKASGSRPRASRPTMPATCASTTTACRTCRTSTRRAISRGSFRLSSVAAMQGRKIAEHVMGLHTREHRHLDYDKAASAIFTEPEIADVGLAEAEAFAEGRKIRVTKVPFSASAKALINNDPRGFVKIISDPATGVVLGGSIVGGTRPSSSRSSRSRSRPT